MLYTYDNPEEENERILLHTDNGSEEKSERKILQPDNVYEGRNLQNFDTLSKDAWNTSAFYDPKYNEVWKNDQDEEIYTRAMDMLILIEAKPDATRSRRTLLTIDHFKEI